MGIYYKHLGERLACISSGKISLDITINKKVKEISIICNKVIELQSLELEPNIQGISIESSLATESNQAIYTSKWNVDNNYYYKIKLNNDAFLKRITIYANVNNQRSEWIYYSKLIIKDENNEITKHSFEDQYKEFKSSYQKLDTGINKIKNEIAYNILCRKNAGTTFKALTELKSTLLDDEFSFYYSMIKNTLNPAVLTPHGYRLSLTQLPSCELEDILVCFNENIKELGYEIFINSGTLLGAVRDGKFIPHDDDVDFAILLKGESWDAVYKEIQILEENLRNKNLIRGGKIGAESGIFHWKLKYINSISADLFPCWIIDEKLYIWPYCFGDATKNDLLPFSEQMIGTTKFKAPNIPEKILSINYGDDWSIPNPLFKFDWTNAAKRFSDYVKTLKAGM